MTATSFYHTTLENSWKDKFKDDMLIRKTTNLIINKKENFQIKVDAYMGDKSGCDYHLEAAFDNAHRFNIHFKIFFYA